MTDNWLTDRRYGDNHTTGGLIVPPFFGPTADTNRHQRNTGKMNTRQGRFS